MIRTFSAVHLISVQDQPLFGATPPPTTAAPQVSTSSSSCASTRGAPQTNKAPSLHPCGRHCTAAQRLPDQLHITTNCPNRGLPAAATSLSVLTSKYLTDRSSLLCSSCDETSHSASLTHHTPFDPPPEHELAAIRAPQSHSQALPPEWRAEPLARPRPLCRA